MAAAAALCALAQAPEIRVLSAGAVEPGLRVAIAHHEQASGDRVTVTTSG